MTRELPQKLGGEFWFSLAMIPIALYFAYLGFVMGSGRNLLGSLLGGAIFIWRLYDRVQKVRLARHLSENPRMQRIYESWNRE